MSYAIADMSPQAAALLESSATAAPYPFDELEPGKCFTLPLATANVQSLRVRCSQKSKNSKQFAVIVHDELGVVEIARLK